MDAELKTDERGRVVLPREYREKHGKHYRYFTVGDRLEIIPVTDPLETLKEKMSKIPESMSHEELRDHAEENAKEQAPLWRRVDDER